MIEIGYIRSILERFEGKGIAKGYVPCDKEGKPFGASGVTIATGLDLGQQTASSLRAMNLPEAIINRLGLYLGAKKEEALYILARDPLRLTADEVESIDQAVHAAYIASAARLFGEAAFAAAPREAQAVAVSLHYQFGSPVRVASPALQGAWRAMQRGAWRAAAEHLRDPLGWSTSHQQYMRRRAGEAELLEKIK